jgi:hypothetical protein
MEIKWLIIILGFAAVLAVNTFLIREIQDDEKAMLRKSMDGDEMLIAEETVTEIRTDD